MSADMLDGKIDQFECACCNLCCRQPGYVYLTPEDVSSASQYLGIGEFEFINRYCELQDRRKLVLKKLADESCIFLIPEGCSIHPAKPEQCRTFPIKWRTPSSLLYCEGIKKLLQSDS